MRDLIDHRMRKARKEHCCSFCLRPIRVGWLYEIETTKDDDGLFVWKNHPACRELTKGWSSSDCEEFDAHEYLAEGFRWPTYDDTGAVIDMPDETNCWQWTECGWRGTHRGLLSGLCRECVAKDAEDGT